MPYNYLIIADIEEGYEISPSKTYYCNGENHLAAKIRECSDHSPHASICVYKLEEINKVIEPPKTKRYKYINGEIIPA